jgi:uncharacterized ion transporter superfamily protein YfcC
MKGKILPSGKTSLKEKLKNLRMPHVFVLLTSVIFVCSVFSYFIPSGFYERETKQIGSLNRTVVKPGTYKEIPKEVSFEGIIFGSESESKAVPVSFFGFLSSIPRGMESAAGIIFFIFIVGGVFGILQRSGTIMAFIQKLFDLLGHKGEAMVIILMIVVGTGASTLGMGEEFIPLVPLFLIVSKELGYDRIFGFGIIMIAAEVGFAAATTNPFTVQIAQGIAEVPLNSGLELRLILFTVTIIISIIYLLRYGRKIKKDSSKSIMADDDFSIEHITFEKTEFRKEHGIVILTSIVLFGFIIFAVQELGWWLSEMAGGFLLIGIVTIIISRIPINDAVKSFVKGMEDMIVAAMVVGFAKGVQVVLEDGQIIDTIIYSAANTLQNYHEFVGAAGMLVFQTTLNFFIPSGSGQAAVTMPLMAPLADLLGITRQTAVLAFTCGDGFSNMIIPTSGFLMAMLSLAKVPYTKWIKFILPLFLILMILSFIFVGIAVAIDY